jgi:hypothetical protein
LLLARPSQQQRLAQALEAMRLPEHPLFLLRLCVQVFYELAFCEGRQVVLTQAQKKRRL